MMFLGDDKLSLELKEYIYPIWRGIMQYEQQQKKTQTKINTQKSARSIISQNSDAIDLIK